MSQMNPAPIGHADTYEARHAAEARPEDRASFINKTYGHLAGAVVAFMAIEAGLIFAGVHHMLIPYVANPISWLVFLGLFMAVGWIAEKWASSDTSQEMQYAGLGLYVVAEAVLFLPFIGIIYSQLPDAFPVIVGGAGIATLVMFTIMTAYVFITGANFSWLRGALTIGMIGAIGLIICAAIFGFNLGIIFSVAMVILACGYVLYYTSNVLHEYRVGQHVAASLALFAALALLFWYILRIALYIYLATQD